MVYALLKKLHSYACVQWYNEWSYTTRKDRKHLSIYICIYYSYHMWKTFAWRQHFTTKGKLWPLKTSLIRYGIYVSHMTTDMFVSTFGSWFITEFVTRVTRGGVTSGAVTVYISGAHEFVDFTFVIFLLVIVLSVVLSFTDSDYSFGILKLFFLLSSLKTVAGKKSSVTYLSWNSHNDSCFLMCITNDRVRWRVEWTIK